MGAAIAPECASRQNVDGCTLQLFALSVNAASDPLKQDCSPSEQGTPPEPAIPRDDLVRTTPYHDSSDQLDQVHFDMIVTESLTLRLECVLAIDSTSMLSTGS